MEFFFKHLLHRRVLPLLLLPITMCGCFCFATLQLPQAFRSGSADRAFVIVLSLIGILGTIVTFIILRFIYRRESTWRIFDLGRTAWMALLILAWLVGAGCGVLMLIDTRQ